MELRLESVSKQVAADTHLYPFDLEFQTGSVNVLLGATLAGKTTLLRIAAGLDQPTTGRILAQGRDVSRVSVRQRNLAMVYQQFVNYPSLTVFENIASPLRLQRRSRAEIERRVGEVAETLRISAYLDRLPAELSGGQQQRTALARALAKDADLLLLDEPLVNLDYKLREELRSELTQLFRGGRTTVLYATTEPAEALQLGGHTAVLHAGRVLQFGPTYATYRRPATLKVAQAFSDPPLNVFAPAELPVTADAKTRHIAVRAHHLHTDSSRGGIPIDGRVELAEISGSETFLHVAYAGRSIVALLPGVRDYSIGAACRLFIEPQQLFEFDAAGSLVASPERT